MPLNEAVARRSGGSRKRDGKRAGPAGIPAVLAAILSLTLVSAGAYGAADEVSGKLRTGGIWHPEVRPKAVYHDGSTYFTWVDPEGAVGVSEVVHATGQVQHAKVGETHVNDHTVPSILIREPDHRVVLFWTHHGGSEVYRRVTEEPRDITAWGEVQSFPAAGVTYTQNVQLAGEDGRIYVFYRSRNRWLYRTSDDGGETFSDPTVMLADYSDQRPRIQVVADEHRIHVVDGAAYYGVWHFYYEDGAFHRTDGTLIREQADLPIESRDELTRVYDHTKPDHHDTRGCDLALDADGRPYYTFTVRVDHRNDHRHQYARWTGSKWEHHEVAKAGSSVKDGGFPMSGGIYLNHDDPSIVYSSRQMGPGVYGIFKYATDDGGRSWMLLQQYDGKPDDKNFRPNYVRHHAAAEPGTGIEVLWNAGHVHDGRTDYTTDIWGYPVPKDGAYEADD